MQHVYFHTSGFIPYDFREHAFFIISTFVDQYFLMRLISILRNIYVYKYIDIAKLIYKEK